MVIIVFHILLFLILTLLTQVGGLALILGLLISNQFEFRFRKPLFVLFMYLFFTYLAVPFIAPFFGREKLKNTEKIMPTSYMTILLNRNYVRPEMNELLQRVSDKLPTGMALKYLDANFPFIDNFPLLPHLSHNDGRKIDLSFVYSDSTGKMTNLKPSRSGCGIFENPENVEFSQTEFCLAAGYWQYDYPKYLTLGEVNDGLTFSVNGTKELMIAILSEYTVGKVFIEKHLRERMKLKDDRLKFQGCQAVRHDDHIHIQLK